MVTTCLVLQNIRTLAPIYPWYFPLGRLSECVTIRGLFVFSDLGVLVYNKTQRFKANYGYDAKGIYDARQRIVVGDRGSMPRTFSAG